MRWESVESEKKKQKDEKRVHLISCIYSNVHVKKNRKRLARSSISCLLAFPKSTNYNYKSNNNCGIIKKQKYQLIMLAWFGYQ